MIAEMGDGGHIVILDRGSRYILNDHPDAYRILLIDGFVSRLHFIKDHCDQLESRAVRAVKGGDKRRNNLYRKLGKTDHTIPFCITWCRI
jgi:hypothetical protein